MPWFQPNTTPLSVKEPLWALTLAVPILKTGPTAPTNMLLSMLKVKNAQDQKVAGSSMMSKFYCNPPTEADLSKISSDIEEIDFSAVSGSAKAAGAGIVTIILLWVLSPIIICVCICVCCCACNKTCCFAPKPQQIVMQGAGQQPQMMAPK